jgi:hypothetical protein
MAATILDFPELPAPPRTRKTRSERTSAEVVLFPGVRYERWADERPKQDAPRVERDRLQLIE